jgi:hypothetical protein
MCRWNKRIERQAPQLVNLVKQAERIPCRKVGLSRSSCAKVCHVPGYFRLNERAVPHRGWCSLSRSAFSRWPASSMTTVQIDVFLFGQAGASARADGPRPTGTCYIPQVAQTSSARGRYTLWPGDGSDSRQFYFPDAAGGATNSALTRRRLPVYVMFVTDGSTSDKAVD